LKREQDLAKLEQYKSFYKTADTDEDRQAWKIEIGLLTAELFKGKELQAEIEKAEAEEAALLEE
jgi:hypothetical protein